MRVEEGYRGGVGCVGGRDSEGYQVCRREGIVKGARCVGGRG